ncbi:PREDICTED: metal transporter CNNM4-like isoform X1 [Papilio polytes]|uniref:metal transporter CNNM4-like isoform X1 n=1 Tax=Papilio polytes TaxID=76194 RepID=UPI0006766D20|nr:PREDICTED: metal transporter CNNM4-like isoform X1 [Papilio polytes]
MAPVSKVLRTCGLLFYLILKVYSEEPSVGNPWIVNLEVESKQCVDSICNYLLHVRGVQFLGHYSWRLTPGAASVGSDCGELYPNYEIKNVETSEADTRLEVVVPNLNGKIYFCLQDPQKKDVLSRWKYIHQGAKLFLDPKNDVISAKDIKNTSNEKTKNESIHQNTEGENAKTTWVDLSHDIDVNYLPNTQHTRKQRDNIEVLVNDNYVPINIRDHAKLETFDPHEFEFDDPFNNRIKRKPNGRYRYRREIINKENREHFEEIKTSDDIIGPFDDKIDHKVNPDDVNGQNKRQTSPRMPFFTTVKADPVPIVVEGLRIERSDKEPVIIEEGIPSVLAGSGFTLRLFGQGLTRRTVIAFTHDPMDYGQPCKFLVKGEYMVKEDSLFPRTALFDMVAPQPINGHKLYVCAKNLKFGARSPDEDEEKYLHMGFDTWTMLATHNNLLPLWATLTLIVICLGFSALFSGLNLGLMSLDRTELKIISNTGTDKERKYSRAIMPVRDHGNYLLCSILLGNVAVNSTFTILLDGLTSGLFAVILSTLAIVLLGEITPQAICSRHGLMIGAKTIMVTKAVMALTAPMAYPVSKLLDYFLGEEIGSVYNRERLKELVKVTTDVNDLDKDEVNIISGALELRKKTVSDVMTKLEDAFMLPITSILDFETMSEIIKSGYSRIPVYEGSRVNVVTVLFIKDLAFVDPDDNTPLKTLCQYYQNPCNFVFEDVTLDVMFKQFKEGHKGHMAFVHRINNEGEGDPFYETIGLVTLEDVIEEMIQAEIVDETDVFMDNRTKRRRNRPQNKLQDFAAFAERHENQRIHISPQLTLATFQFLSTSVDAFRPDTVSETVLRRLLKQDVIQHIKVKNKSKRDACTYVFQQGKPVDYFVLVLEGRVEVTVGRENLVFEAGPFTYFGVQALTQNIGVAESPTPSAMGSLQNINMDSMLRHTFVPDYSVRAITELYYLTVKRSLYLAAKRATLMEKGALSKGATNEQFDTEVDKLLQSVDEDISISGEHKTPSRQVSPNPMPVSASPLTRSSFARASPDKSGDKADEQEKLLK